MQITIKYDDAVHRVRVCHGDECSEVVVPGRSYFRLYNEDFVHGPYVNLEIPLAYMVNVLYSAKVPAYKPTDMDRSFDHTCVVDYNDGKLSITLDGTQADIKIKHAPNSKYIDYEYSGLSRDCVRVLYMLYWSLPKMC